MCVLSKKILRIICVAQWFVYWVVIIRLVVLKLRRGDATTGNGIWECREIEKDREKEVRERGHLNEHCNGLFHILSFDGSKTLVVTNLEISKHFYQLFQSTLGVILFIIIWNVQIYLAG